MDAQGRPSQAPLLFRLFTDREFRRRAIRYALGKPMSLASEDRSVLENTIFKYYTSLPEVKSVLFVGVQWYTRHYEKQFFADKNFWTVDIAPEVRKFGARQHVTTSVEDLAKHFSPGSFDLVIMNGVYGHGLNDKEPCEQAFDACYQVLREGGHFMFGWNDIPEHRGAPLDTIASLSRFKPCECPPLGQHRYLSNPAVNHIFQFYRKPAA